MITQEEDMEVHALKKQGWSLSAIARHTGLDRKTVRAYLNGERQVGVRQRSDDDIDPFDRIELYVRQRLKEDRHLRAKVLFAEIQDLAGGYERSYETFCRQIRRTGSAAALRGMLGGQGPRSCRYWASARR